MERDRQQGLPVPLILALFFASGALALVYQVVWARMMMHVFGSTAVAVGTVLAAFMTGLAAGSWLIGRIADRSGNCLRLYALLEFGIALGALVSHVLLSRIGPAHLALFELTGGSPAVFGFARFALAFVLVLAPTILMGATLPVLTRFLAANRSLVGVNLSTLYATNTFGAVTGVVVTGFFLIGKYGVHSPAHLAIGGNLLIGCIAWLASKLESVAAASSSTPADMDEPTPADTGTPSDTATIRIVLLGLGISGFTSFAYEIYWTRSLVFIVGNSTYALTTMLSAFLTGIALGGYLARFLVRHCDDRPAVFGALQVLLGGFSALALPLLFSVADPQALSQQLLDHAARAYTLTFSWLGLAFLVMLVPATLIGATFPLVGQIGVRDPGRTGGAVGRIYAINTAGNVLGALLPGLFLLAWLGIQKGILAMAALNIALGAIILAMRLLRRGRHPAWRAALPALLAVCAIALSRAPLDFQFPSEGERDYFETLFYREGPLATTKVYRDPVSDEKHISVDGIVIGGTGNTEFKQLLLAHLPKLLLQDVAGELSVGIGSGILVGESARHGRVASITGVEIEPGVIAGARWFAAENHDILENPRFTAIEDDIGSFLRTTSAAYQVISADEKTADEYASNGFSYSLDYYELLRGHLAEDGLVAQWVPTTLPPSQYRMVLKTFSRAFPYVQLWYFLPAQKRGPFNTILIGSNEPVKIDYAHIRAELQNGPEAYASLRPYGLTSADALLPHFVADEQTLREAVSSASVNTLDRPRYEFYFPWDYAAARRGEYIENHDFLVELKRRAFPRFMANLAGSVPDAARLQRTLVAEFRYLESFSRFLKGIPVTEQYRLFDEALAMAPWNDSLRARIYAQYAYIAATQRSPLERERLTRRAEALYPKHGHP